MIKRAGKVMLLLLALVSAAVMWQQAQLAVLAMARMDPLPYTRQLVAAQHYAEAAEYLGFFMQYDYVSSDPQAQSLAASIADTRSEWRYQLAKLQQGLVDGTSDETIGLTAAVVTDFLVIGDVRDLTRQGLNLVRGEEVDDTLVALASLGLLASAAQIMSGVGTLETAGAATPVLLASSASKSALVTLKAARKVGKLPPWLAKTLTSEAKLARQSKSLAGVSELLGDVSVLANTSGGLRLLSRTGNQAELSRMARFVQTFGEHSAMLYRLGGDVALQMAHRAPQLGKSTIMLAATFGQRGLRVLDNLGAVRFTKYVSRAAKLAYKGDLLRLLAKWLLQLPHWLLMLFIVLAALIWLPWHWFKRLWGRKTLSC
ncbi:MULTISPECIES: hypothetical protein [Vibrio]|uniref:Uncharacterized protein n=1 Tax=Vibrio ostreae TaxID=2841925 RepID=A0A975U5W8_9VIBR|nr:MULTISPECIES: hypothetical protein [Vibrio]QXO15727.1 hypothetical protein KNV97_04755 [Vibrio ostreae]